MPRFRLIFLIALALVTHAPAQAPAAREWTSADGRKLTATYLGMKDSAVVLKLANGKTTELPVTRLSPADQLFLKGNSYVYCPAWQAWPPESRMAMRLVSVEEDKAGAKSGESVYTTKHFRFVSDVDLGTALMKDLASVFELTYRLHSVSPLGTLAEPEDGKLFQAKLYGNLPDYQKAGGLPRTAGIYLLKEKVFLAPLDLMGVKKGSAGWRRDRDSYDLTTVIHELTHMLTHGMLNNLPVWVNEGYAEYIARIPIVRDAFATDAESIRDGVIDTLITDSDRMSGVPKPRTGVLHKADRLEFQKSKSGPQLIRVADVLQMKDAVWLSQSSRPDILSPFSGRPKNEDEYFRINRLYRTAHLILYYYLQIEGEKGALKIRKFLAENQKRMARYDQYVEEFAQYRVKLNAFMELPGVSKLPDGRVEYPTTLTPPKAPEAPFTDPDSLKMGGLEALLAGETAEAVGKRIEAALIADLGIPLQFKDDLRKSATTPPGGLRDLIGR